MATSRGRRFGSGSGASRNEGRGTRENRSAYRGADGFAHSEEVNRRAKEKREAIMSGTRNPFRVWIPPGNSVQLIILDEEPSFFRYEHNLKNHQTGKYDVFTGCVNDWDHCPVCEALGKDPYYALYLTVIDLSEYTNSRNEKVEFTRKLLVVKSAQHKKFQRIMERCDREGRSMRGALIECVRDGEKDSAIGNDIEFIEFVEEDELQTYVRSYKDAEGKKHTEACFEAYDYDELFPEPDADELRRMVGADPVPGSRAHRSKELGDDSAAPSRARRGRGSASSDDAPFNDGDDGWQDSGGVASRRPTRSSAPSREDRAQSSRRTSRGDSDDLPEDGDDIPARPQRTIRLRGRRG